MNQPDQCPRHGGAWGQDETCAYCTYENGTPRPKDEPGDIGEGATMKLIHQDTEVLTEEQGNAGGDIDLGKNFSKRFIWKGDDNQFRIATITFFVAAKDAEGKDVDYDDMAELDKLAEDWEDRRRHFVLNEPGYRIHEAIRAWESDHPRPIRYYFQAVLETAVTEDADEIDSSDYEYVDDGPVFYDTLAEAEDYAEGECKTYEPRDFSPEKF